MFDHIRQVSTGHLHKVLYQTESAYYTVRIVDGQRAVVKREDAERIYRLSAYPGDDEVLLRSAC